MFEKMTAADYKERVIADFSPDSPKLRLSIITYLFEAGVTENVVEEADAILRFCTDGRDNFLKELDLLDGDTIVEDELPLPNPESGAGYL